MPPKKIFINYRREDTEHAAGRLFKRLELDFARDELVMDIHTFKLGRDFEKALDAELRESRALLALIGPNWLNAKDESGRRRINDPQDYVRQEIVAALARDIPVFPVLVGGATMPPAKELPEALSPLSTQLGVSLRHTTFDADVEPIIKAIKGNTKRRILQPRWIPITASAVLLSHSGLLCMGSLKVCKIAAH